MGLFSSLRQLYRAYKGFGNEEIQILKAKLLENQQLLEHVKRLEQENAVWAEKQTLEALRQAMEQLQSLQDHRNLMEKQVDKTLNAVESRAKTKMKMEENDALLKLMQNLDIKKILEGQQTSDSNNAEHDEKKK
eukprot:jgi/Picsp_1/1920/NSC_05386-R1_---NA---